MFKKINKYIKDKLYSWLPFNSFLLYLSVREMNKELSEINETLEECFKFIHTEESLAKFHSRAKNIHERVNKSLDRLIETRSMKYKFFRKEYGKLYNLNLQLKEKVKTLELMMQNINTENENVILEKFKGIENLPPEGKKIN